MGEFESVGQGALVLPSSASRGSRRTEICLEWELVDKSWLCNFEYGLDDEVPKVGAGAATLFYSARITDYSRFATLVFDFESQASVKSPQYLEEMRGEAEFLQDTP